YMPSLVTYTSPALSSATPPGDRRKSMPLNGNPLSPPAAALNAAEERVPRSPVTPTAETSSAAAAPTRIHFLRFDPERGCRAWGSGAAGGGTDAGGPVRRGG